MSAAFGPGAGFVEGWLRLLSGVIDNAVYPCLRPPRNLRGFGTIQGGRRKLQGGRHGVRLKDTPGVKPVAQTIPVEQALFQTLRIISGYYLWLCSVWLLL